MARVVHAHQVEKQAEQSFGKQVRKMMELIKQQDKRIQELEKKLAISQDIFSEPALLNESKEVEESAL